MNCPKCQYPQFCPCPFCSSNLPAKGATSWKVQNQDISCSKCGFTAPAYSLFESALSAYQAKVNRVAPVSLNFSYDTINLLKSLAASFKLGVTETIHRALSTQKMITDLVTAGDKLLVVKKSGETQALLFPRPLKNK